MVDFRARAEIFLYFSFFIFHYSLFIKAFNILRTESLLRFRLSPTNWCLFDKDGISTEIGYP